MTATAIVTNDNLNAALDNDIDVRWVALGTTEEHMVCSKNGRSVVAGELDGWIEINDGGGDSQASFTDVTEAAAYIAARLV